ncbi:MAG: hypothetical protein QHH14_13130 [Clostridiales bacterium]|nr:hypothetical protein [Clostridiales bacterium]
MRTIFRFIAVSLAITAAFFFFVSSGEKNGPSSQGYSTEEALKVLRAIEQVERESSQPWNGPLREVAVTESELNSYIAYRIETEREEIMKELRLKLFDKNRVEGKIRIDLRGQRIPQFINPELNFYFSAYVLVSGGLVKIDVKELFLEDEPIKLELLDMVIAFAARLSGEEPTSINDWYELPYGIKDIKTQKGKAIFYY